jgi:hypothetical protein
LLHLLTAGFGRFCCKSPFALAIKNFPGFICDFRVKMWGTSSSDDKLADDLGNAIEGTRIGGRRFSFFTAGNLAPGNRGLLQQYLHIAAVGECPPFAAIGGTADLDL